MQKRALDTFSGEDVRHNVMPIDVVDEEIKLIDILMVLRRRWIWLLAGVLGGIAIAGAYMYTTVPNYEANGSIEIGKIHEVGPVENADVLSVQLLDEYGSGSRDDAPPGSPYLKRVTKKSGNVLELVVVGRSPDAAKEFVADVIEKLIRRHESIYEEAVAPLQRRLKIIESEIDLLTKQAKEQGELVGRLKEFHPAQASVLAVERGHLYGRISGLERDRTAIQQQTTRPSSNLSEMVARPILPTEPVGPRAPITLTTGAVLGLLLGLFAAFLREFIENAQTHRRRAV